MMQKTLLSVVALATIAGCTISVRGGTGVAKIADATQETLERQFVPGVARREDVALELGAPTDKATAAGLDIWNYRYTRDAAVRLVLVGIPVGSKKVASFYFDDASGVLKKVEYQVGQR